MDTKLEIEKINLSDRAVRIISEDGFFRAVAVKNTASAKMAQQNHNYTEEVAVPLAEVIAFANLMSSFLKGEERILADLQNYKNIGKLYAEAMPLGEVRAYSQPEAYDYAKIFKLSRILYGEPQPITGIVEYSTEDMNQIFEEYLRMSEQIPSYSIIDAYANMDGIMEQSGGLLLQAMPGAGDNDIKQVECSIRNAGKFSDYLAKGMRPDQILKEIMPFNFSVVKSTRIDFFCRCNKDLFLSKLLTLGKEEIISMQEDRHNELVCQFCNKKYKIEDEDFTQILFEIQAKNN